MGQGGEGGHGPRARPASRRPDGETTGPAWDIRTGAKMEPWACEASSPLEPFARGGPVSGSGSHRGRFVRRAATTGADEGRTGCDAVGMGMGVGVRVWASVNQEQHSQLRAMAARRRRCQCHHGRTPYHHGSQREGSRRPLATGRARGAPGTPSPGGGGGGGGSGSGGGDQRPMGPMIIASSPGVEVEGLACPFAGGAPWWNCWGGSVPVLGLHGSLCSSRAGASGTHRLSGPRMPTDAYAYACAYAGAYARGQRSQHHGITTSPHPGPSMHLGVADHPHHHGRHGTTRALAGPRLT
ncbi:hypothetical protein BS50DRAFT_586732 [Corynespora cassiicola Philippines]|uniref:Uncharacterized protein n=1 Tax=Corynespora cassiicola Philippines TaxID=1448308 RepID=A0A2T2NVK4_CORCC|nr:hypothetical protein BS50DRAFT_586732 [Corynespora cassiicola Philippines]